MRFCRLCVALFILLAHEGGALADDFIGIVTKVRGQVTAQKTGEEKAAPLRSGDRIAVGQIIRTGGDAVAQLVLTDDSVIHVLSATTLQIGQYIYSVEDQRRSAVIKVIDGAARFIVYKERNRESRFTVVTEHAKIFVGISDFFVSASPTGTEVANIGPTLSVENYSYLTTGRVRLGTNQKSAVRGKEPPSQPATVTPEQRRNYLKDANI
jgi:hypothetical protein